MSCHGGAYTWYNRLPNNSREAKSSTNFLTREDIPRDAFFKTDQHTPAGLVRILLFRAGIELNPGPTVKYVCPICKSTLRSNSKSVQCSACSEWIHVRKLNNCSGLTSLKQYTSTLLGRGGNLLRHMEGRTTGDGARIFFVRIKKGQKLFY